MDRGTLRYCLVCNLLLSTLTIFATDRVGPLEVEADFSNHTYYVSPGGDNGNSGLSESAALATLEYAVESKARSALNNGHDVKIRLLPGIYYEGKTVLNVKDGGKTLNSDGLQTALVIEGAGEIGAVKVSGGRIYATSEWKLVDSSKNIWALNWDRNWGFHAGSYDTNEVIAKRRELVFIVDPDSGKEKMLKPVIIEHVDYSKSSEKYSWGSYSDPRDVLKEWEFGVADFGPGDTINGIDYTSSMHSAGGGKADDDKIFIRLPDNLTLDSSKRPGSEVASKAITLAETEELLLIEKSNLEIRNIVFQHCASRNQQSGQWHNVPIRIGGDWDGVIDRNILIEDVMSYRCAGAGLQVRAGEDLVVRNLDWIENGSRAGGIQADRAWIEDVDVIGNNWRGGPVGFTVHTTGGIGIAGKEHTYVNCRFNENWGMAWRQDIHSYNFVMEGCEFNDNPLKSGVELEATPVGPLRFTDCEFNGNDEAGVFMLTACNTTFDHCEMKDNKEAQFLFSFMDRTDVPIMSEDVVNNHFTNTLMMVGSADSKIYDMLSGANEHDDYGPFVQNELFAHDNRYFNTHDNETKAFCNKGAYFADKKTYVDFNDWVDFVSINNLNNEAGSEWGDPANEVNQAPSIAENQSFIIREFLPNRSVVGKVMADDPNSGRYDFTFTIDSGNSGNAFSIGPSGYIRVFTSAELVSGNTYMLAVTVEDPSGLTDTESVTVSVVGNVKPKGYDDAFIVAEGASNGTAVGRATFVDPGDMESLVYSIDAGNDNGVFVIDADGMITVQDYADLLSSYTHTLTIRATDSGDLHGDAIVTITVASDNAAPTVLSGQSFTIAEDSPTGIVIGTVSATDPDGDDLSFALSGDDGGYGVFDIDIDTGELSVLNGSGLDYEVTPEYEVVVTATDNGTPSLSSSRTVFIFLTEVETVNHDPEIGSSAVANPETIYVDETTALHCSASDPDGDTLTFTWSKTAGPGTVSSRSTARSTAMTPSRLSTLPATTRWRSSSRTATAARSPVPAP